jgi:hypothetical protein
MPNESAIIVRLRVVEENFKKSFTTDSKVELKELCVRMAALLSSDPDPDDTSLVDWTPRTRRVTQPHCHWECWNRQPFLL